MDLGQPIRTTLKESINRNDVTLSASYIKEYGNIVFSHYSETYRNPEFNELVDNIIRDNRNQLKEIIWLCVGSSRGFIGIYDDDIITKMIHNKVSQLLLQNDNEYYEVTDESTNDAYSLSAFMVTLDTLIRFYLSCYKSSSAFIGFLFHNYRHITMKTIDSLHDEYTNVMRFLKDVLLYMLDRMEDEFRNDGRI